jgi:hypothetical protein
MAPTNPTEPGWYPDPWGTGGERRYDGTAWGRETRPGPDAPAPIGTPEPTPVGAAATGTASAPSGDLPPAAWYPDPAGSPGLRYWDGTAWTAHTAYTDGPGAAVAPRDDADPGRLLESERNLAKSLRVLLLFAGPALAVQIVATAIFVHAIAPFYREIFENPNGPVDVTIDVPDNMLVSLVSNAASMVFLATGFVFIIWLGTAGKVARAKGLPLRRSPWVGAWSLAIPILNYWWPYRATKDLFVADAPERALVTRWWTLWIATMLLQMATAWTSMFGAPDGVIIAVASVASAVTIAAALSARRVVAAVEARHADLVGVPVQA